MFLKTQMNSIHQSKIIIKTTLVIVVVVFYDFLIDIVLSLLHALFEFIEQGLDVLIEHLFSTSPHTTEFIVFYLMLFSFGFIVFKTIRAMVVRCHKLRENLMIYYHQEKLKALDYWGQLTLIKKIEWLGLGITGLTFLYFWLFS